MEFAAGQVFNMGKITSYFKRTKEKKLTEQQNEEAVLNLFHLKGEIDTLKSSLEYMTDRDCIEANIYRLKAAELEFNRQIKMAKTLYTKS